MCRRRSLMDYGGKTSPTRDVNNEIEVRIAGLDGRPSLLAHAIDPGGKKQYQGARVLTRAEIPGSLSPSDDLIFCPATLFQ